MTRLCKWIQSAENNKTWNNTQNIRGQIIVKKRKKVRQINVSGQNT